MKKVELQNIVEILKKRIEDSSLSNEQKEGLTNYLVSLEDKNKYKWERKLNHFDRLLWEIL